LRVEFCRECGSVLLGPVCRCGKEADPDQLEGLRGGGSGSGQRGSPEPPGTPVVEREKDGSSESEQYSRALRDGRVFGRPSSEVGSGRIIRRGGGSAREKRED
jgi:hypothetical protein